jgi:hypothetical protein
MRPLQLYFLWLVIDCVKLRALDDVGLSNAGVDAGCEDWRDDIENDERYTLKSTVSCSCTKNGSIFGQE